jgi:hypothetical protein
MRSMGEIRPLLIGLGAGLLATAVLWGLAYALGAPYEIYGALALIGVCCGSGTGVILWDNEFGPASRERRAQQRHSRRA